MVGEIKNKSFAKILNSKIAASGFVVNDFFFPEKP